MKKDKIITSDELKAKIDNHEDFILVDVLSHSDYTRTHIQGAINIPLEELDTKAGQWLSHQIDIIVYSSSARCHGGQFAQEYLSTHGFRVWRLEGGIEEWTQKLYPLEGDPNYKPHDIVSNPFAPKPAAPAKPKETWGQPPLPGTKPTSTGTKPALAGTRPPQTGIAPPPKPGNIVQKPTPKPPQQQQRPIPKKKAA